MKFLLPIVLFSAALWWIPSTRAQTAIDILLKHEDAKVTELENYLKANPEAKDKEAALLMLIESLSKLDRKNDLLGRYEEVFALMDKRKKVGFPIVEPMVDLYIQTGQREKGLSFIYRIGGMFEESTEMGDFVYRMATRLKRPQVGETMDISFEDMEGRQINLADYRGKVVLVSFWATWSPPAVSELPYHIEMYRQHRAKGFEIIGISLDENRAELEQLIRTQRITWPQKFSGKGFNDKLADANHINSIPATFLIGRDGTILNTDLRGAKLIQTLEKLLK